MELPAILCVLRLTVSSIDTCKHSLHSRGETKKYPGRFQNSERITANLGGGDVPHTLSPTEVSFREDLGATEGSG